MKKLLLIILLSVGFTNVSYAKIPENARSSNLPLGWECVKDFRKIDDSKCIPDMSDVSSSSMGWKCKSGYSIYQTVTGAKNCKKSKKITIPQNAFASGDKWFCKSGYKKVGNQCLTKKVESGTLIAYGYFSYLPKCKGGQDSYRNNCIGAYKWTGGDEDGWEYFGEWKANKRHGIGIFYFKNPDEEYFGESINDAFSGSGITTYPDGAVWAGVWKNDRVNGLGIYVEDGFVEQGIYNDGKFQSVKRYLPKNATATSLTEFDYWSWNCNNGYVRIKNYICLKSNSETSTFLSSENTSIIPTNSHKVGNGWTCDTNFYRNKSETACLTVPAMSTSTYNSNSFKCNTGYIKTGDYCKRVPKNSKASGSSWTCNYNFYKKTSSSKTCTKVPINSTSSSLSNNFKCNTGYKKSGNKCIITKLIIPKNAKASGSSWICNSGYTKTGKTCTNSAELKRIQEAKKIAQAKAAKVLKAVQLEAQNYYNDLEAFLKTNTKEYDMRKILELRKQNKVILTQPWDQVLEKNFAELKSFTATSKAFRDYHQLRNDARQRAVLNELDKANTRLKNIEAYLNYYVDNNLTSDIALEVLDQIDIAAAGLKKQSLDELSAVSMQLEGFIAKNKLANNFKAFSKSLAKITPDEPEVVVQKIDATDLVNFDFMKKANRGDYIALINLTGKAPHALLNLEGNIVFENDNALSCFYQSKNTIKNDLKYYLYDTFSNKEFLVRDRGFECNQNNLLGYDLVFFEKGTLVKESKSYVASLAAAIGNEDLQLFKAITKEQRNKDFDSRQDNAKDIIKGLEEEMILGFGALVIDNDNTTLCTDVKNTLGQARIMKLLSNEFTRMGYGKSVGNISFNSVEDTFANVQRDRCGFIYAGEDSLANLLKAFKSSGTKYDVLPVWYSKSTLKALALTGQCNSGFTKTGKTCTNTAELERIKNAKKIAEDKATKVLKVVQLDAQNYYADLDAFLKTNTSEFDIAKLTKLMASNKAIFTESWNKVLEKNFADLKSFTSSSKAFQDYHQLKNDKRQKLVLNTLNKAKTRLKNINAYLNFFLQNNITSNIALEVLEKINISSESLKGQDLDELSKLSVQLEQFIAKNKLAKDFQAFSKSLIQSSPDEPEVVIKKIEVEDPKVLKAIQLDAQNYYSDLDAFLKTNTSEFDIVNLIKLMASNKGILSEPWNKVLEKNFAALKNFTSSSKAFQDYHQLKNDQRYKVLLNKLDKANTRLKNINAYLNFFAQNNITSDIILEVLEQINISSEGLQNQNLDELSQLSAQLEQFIAKNKLTKDFQAFSKSLTQGILDEPEVVVQKIDATDLVKVDFIKKANRADYLSLVNLSGKAPHALLNLEGNIVFENDNALSCFYQSKNTIKNDLKYYLYDTFSNKEFLVRDRGFECNQNNLLGYDLVFFEKGTLVKESKSYVASLAAAIGNEDLQLFKAITKEQRNKDFDSRQDNAKDIIKGLEEEMILGFGALVIDNDNTTLCTDVKNTLGQARIMKLLSNEFTRMGYGKSVGNISFNSVEDTFANVQRDRCGFIYAGEDSLANLLKAFKSSGTKYDVLPVWYSKKMVKNEQLRQEGKEQSELIEGQKVKEQKEKAKELARLRAEAELEELKASGILKAQEQIRLQARHRNTVEAHIQLLEKEVKLLLDKDPEYTINEHMDLVGPIMSLYPGLVNYIKNKFKESWELSKLESVKINDFGLGSYRGRMIDTFMTDITFKLMNRSLGEYETTCARVAIIDDKEFEMLREPKLVNCELGSLDSYKKKLDFQSNWIVK